MSGRTEHDPGRCEAGAVVRLTCMVANTQRHPAGLQWNARAVAELGTFPLKDVVLFSGCL